MKARRREWQGEGGRGVAYKHLRVFFHSAPYIRIRIELQYVYCI